MAPTSLNNLSPALRLVEQVKQRAALAHAYDLIAHGVMPEQWPNSALDAYTDRHCKHLAGLSDAQLLELYNCPNSDVACELYHTWTGRTMPNDDTVDPMQYWIRKPLD